MYGILVFRIWVLYGGFSEISERTASKGCGFIRSNRLGKPLKFWYCSKNVTAASTAAGQKKQIVKSSVPLGDRVNELQLEFGLFNAGNWFFSVLCKLGLMFLPVILYGIHPSHFFCNALVIVGHQKYLTALDSFPNKLDVDSITIEQSLVHLAKINKQDCVTKISSTLTKLQGNVLPSLISKTSFLFLKH